MTMSWGKALVGCHVQPGHDRPVSHSNIYQTVISDMVKQRWYTQRNQGGDWNHMNMQVHSFRATEYCKQKIYFTVHHISKRDLLNTYLYSVSWESLASINVHTYIYTYGTNLKLEIFSNKNSLRYKFRSG